MRARRWADALLHAGIALVLIGCVLPWLRDGSRPVWGWDVSVLWVVTGLPRLLRVPPPAAAVVLVLGLVLVAPVLGGRHRYPALGSALSATAFGLGVLVAVRGLALAGDMRLDAGLLSVIAGAVVAGAGSMAQP